MGPQAEARPGAEVSIGSCHAAWNLSQKIVVGKSTAASMSAPLKATGAANNIITARAHAPGAEAALIVGSVYPEVKGVVGVSASHARWEGATARQLPGGPA